MALLQLPFLPTESPPPPLLFCSCRSPAKLPHRYLLSPRILRLPLRLRAVRPHPTRASISEDTTELQADADDVSPEDVEYVSQIKKVLDLLKSNRDMMFEEVKLTILIEDPRDAERKRLLGIDDNDVTRDDLVTALEDVNEGRIPESRVALRLLAEEMMQWPNLEVEKEKKPSKSPYAKITDTGVDPTVAAKRLNIDWDAAIEVESEEETSEPEVPSVVGYGALYLVTALPVLIGVSVVLILFYNSLQ